MDNEEYNIASGLINSVPIEKIIWLGILLAVGIAGIIIKSFIRIAGVFINDLINGREE